MDGLVIHASFDVLAWLAAGAAALWLSRTGRVSFPVPQPLRFAYLAALVFGAGVGAVAVRQRQSLALRAARHRPLDRGRGRGRDPGDRNLQAHRRASRCAPGRASRCRSRSASRSGASAASFPGSMTSPTARRPALPWGHDFGDGVPRHPVQLYESAAMAAFAGVYRLARAARRPVLHRARLLSRGRLLRRCSASSGNSSSPTAR